jgi:catechol 2,3-dioxygenase
MGAIGEADWRFPSRRAHGGGEGDPPREGGMVRMATAPLDLRALAEAAPGPVPGRLPEATVVGHVHLKVGDVAEAERFWSGVAGLSVSARYAGQAVFLARDGYHHHLAANAWASRGAGRRAEGTRGLVAFSLSRGLAQAVEDPWGNRAVGGPLSLP